MAHEARQARQDDARGRDGESGALQSLYGLIKSDAVAALAPDADDQASVFDAAISDDRRFLLGQIAEVLPPLVP